MKGKRHRHPELDAGLAPPGQGAKRAGQHGGIEEMPAEQRRHEVGEAEDVQGARQHGAHDAVEPAEVPGDLRPIDGQVRAHGSAEPLRGQDRRVRANGFGCHGSDHEDRG